MRLLSLLLGLLPALATAQPKLALIVDDIGYSAADVQALALPRAVTLSVLPHTPYGAKLAAEARQPIMLHLPMEPQGKAPLEAHTLTNTQSRAQLEQILAAALQDVPEAKGVNNHMGSLLTQDRQRMDWLMADLAKRGLYFVDSRTTAQSQALAAARAAGVPAVARKVFLDNDQAGMVGQWQRALRLARRDGQVVVIAHPHPRTLAFLQAALAKLPATELVPVSALLPAEQLATSGRMKANRG
ncbi:divergent polysaccharide deacetylase family protein [Gallaecimonas kandeliae]|uniref:divergent polysaccharide deacetylase family protein n=1 Tax=Gallaecimonas kandeliae TaxID=3029055 RepID=UPI00264935E3|nr:divergent polysaccharide deacetylase family protein [Gallaecimonas kandeliae]WKE65475.1 divergent polysaccharide deacetylase family protein [Gallaecimonas kandeliae]